MTDLVDDDEDGEGGSGSLRVLLSPSLMSHFRRSTAGHEVSYKSGRGQWKEVM